MQFGLIATFLQIVWLLLDFCSSKWILGSHFHTLGKNITRILVGYSNLIITAFVISIQYRLKFDDCHFIYQCFKWAFLHWLYLLFIFVLNYKCTLIFSHARLFSLCIYNIFSSFIFCLGFIFNFLMNIKLKLVVVAIYSSLLLEVTRMQLVCKFYQVEKMPLLIFIIVEKWL